MITVNCVPFTGVDSTTMRRVRLHDLLRDVEPEPEAAVRSRSPETARRASAGVAARWRRDCDLERSRVAAIDRHRDGTARRRRAGARCRRGSRTPAKAGRRRSRRGVALSVTAMRAGDAAVLLHRRASRSHSSDVARAHRERNAARATRARSSELLDHLAPCAARWTRMRSAIVVTASRRSGCCSSCGGHDDRVERVAQVVAEHAANISLSRSARCAACSSLGELLLLPVQLEEHVGLALEDLRLDRLEEEVDRAAS